MLLSSEERRATGRALEQIRTLLAEKLALPLSVHPIFEDRFGPHGRRFVDQASDYQLDQVIAAVRLGNADTLGHQFRWLRGVLVNRGVCTYHLRVNMVRYATELQALLPGLWPILAPYCAACTAGLDYANLASRCLAEHEPGLAQVVSRRVQAESAMWAEHYGERADAMCLEDQHILISYLNDAVGLEKPESLVGYLDWVKDYQRRKAIAPDHLRLNARILSEEVERALGDLAAPFTRLLGQQQAYL
jgi:hypothetical protein